MPPYVALAEQVYLGGLDLTGVARAVSFGPLHCAMQDASTYADGGWRVVLPGLLSGEAKITANQDQSALDPGVAVGGQHAFTLVPNPTSTAGDVCWIARGVLSDYQPLAGAVGDVASAEITVAYDFAFTRALVAHPLAARTASGNGTAVALAGPTAAQRLYAALHVVDYSGFSSVVVKVQSDDSAGFGSPTDRITFATVTGTGSEVASVAGPFSSETHHRVVWTVTGTGSISFVAAFGVL